MTLLSWVICGLLMFCHAASALTPEAMARLAFGEIDEKSAVADLRTLSRVYETVLDRYFSG